MDNAAETSTVRLLVLRGDDNVGTVLGAADAGTELSADGRSVVTVQPIPASHKVALRPICRGEKVIKFGASIGSATRDIAAGEHVHTHNLASDYTPTYTLDAERPA